MGTIIDERPSSKQLKVIYVIRFVPQEWVGVINSGWGDFKKIFKEDWYEITGAGEIRTTRKMVLLPISLAEASFQILYLESCV